MAITCNTGSCSTRNFPLKGYKIHKLWTQYRIYLRSSPNNPHMPYSNLQSQVWSTEERTSLSSHTMPYSIDHEGSSILSGKDKCIWVITWRILHCWSGSHSLRNSISKITGRRLTRKRLIKPLFPRKDFFTKLPLDI